MARKVIPIPDNKTLVIFIFVLLLFVYYLWTRVTSLEKKQNPIEIQPPRYEDVGRCDNKGDPLTNPYIPPIRCDSGSLMAAPLRMMVPDNAVPINIPTQHYNMTYTQVGIITKQMAHRNEILPLMGRRTVTARDKWQYYTVSGGGAGGNLQAKLPVKVSGKNCSGEYGCPEISSGDDIYVEGYQENFRATIYENGLFSYLPA
jgi:hypothetical protein